MKFLSLLELGILGGTAFIFPFSKAFGATGNLTLEYAQNLLYSAVIDSTGSTAYFG